MSVLESVRNSPKAGVLLGVVLLAGAAVLLAHAFWPEHQPDPSGAYYSDDDGKTYFSDTIYKFPPFDHNGKTAYMAFVFTCNQGNFVGYLIRYKPEAKKQLEDEYAKVQQGSEPISTLRALMANPAIVFGGCEIKLPGRDGWMPRTQTVSGVKSPDGSPYVPAWP